MTAPKPTRRTGRRTPTKWQRFARKMLAENLERQIFVASLPTIMVRAGELGLFRTQHALHEAVRVAGYEWAGQIQKHQKAAKPPAKRKRRKA